jgi:hypothetical protein
MALAEHGTEVDEKAVEERQERDHHQDQSVERVAASTSE